MKRISRVLVDSTNTRPVSFKQSDTFGTSVMKSKFQRSHTDVSSSKSGKRRSGSGKTLGGLNDLNPQDKAKVARLVEQVMQLTNEVDELNQGLNTAQSDNDKYRDNCSKLEIEQEILTGQRKDCLLLLRRYQDKIQFFNDELAYTRKAYDDLSKRYNASQDHIADLECLVENQKEMIESDQQKYESLSTLSKENQELRDELRHKTDDCERYKSKSESLNTNSQYLASQVDGLLSQLTEKDNRIRILEGRMNSDLSAHPVLLEAPLVTGTTTSHEFQESNINESSNSFANARPLFNFAGTPLFQSSKSHTSEQLLASRESDTYGVNTGSELKIAKHYISNLPHSDYHEDLRVGSMTNSSNIVDNEHVFQHQFVEVVPDITGNNLPAADTNSMTMDSVSNKVHAKNTTDIATNTDSSYPLGQSHDEIEQLKLTDSMKEASAVNITAPPLSLTPPRITTTHRSLDSFCFNDSSLDGSVVNVTENNEEGTLTDEYLLQTVNRQHGVVESTDIIEKPLLTSERNASESPYNMPDAPRVATKNKPVLTEKKSMNVMNKATKNSTKRENCKVKWKDANKQRSDEASVPKVKCSKRLKRVAQDSSRKNINDPPEKSFSGSRNSHEIQKKSPKRRASVKNSTESPGLKAWEDARQHFDGYGMELFDLLDQLDEGVEFVSGIDVFSKSNISSFPSILDMDDVIL